MRSLIIRILDTLVSKLMNTVGAQSEYNSIKTKIVDHYPMLSTSLPVDVILVEDTIIDEPIPVKTDTPEPPEKVVEIMKTFDFQAYNITDLSERNFTFDKSHPAYNRILNSMLYQDTRLFPNYSDKIDVTECYFLSMLFPLQLAIGKPLPLEIYEPILAKCIESHAIDISDDDCYLANPAGIITAALELIGIRDQFKVFQTGIMNDKDQPHYWNIACSKIGFNFTAIRGNTEFGYHWKTGDTSFNKILDPWKKEVKVNILKENTKVMLYVFKPISLISI